VWNIRITWWKRWEITGLGDHSFRTCQGRGVVDSMLIIFPGGVVINLGEWYCTHTKLIMWSGQCIKEISQQNQMMSKLLIMYTWYVQTPSSSHSCVGTLLVEICEGHGEHLPENICCILVVRSLRTGMIIRKGMVYSWTRNNWLVEGTAYVYAYFYYALDEGIPWHVRSSTWADGVDQREREGDRY
jgi:hypothetical protein